MPKKSKFHYNSWPLGRLPDEWQRPEPQQIRDLGYAWSDPRDIVELFEQKLASFSGSKFAVTTDSATSAIFLALKYLQLSKELEKTERVEISIPLQTYISIAMQIIHLDFNLVFRNENWVGTYYLSPLKVIDSAGRFAPNMYSDSSALQILSFQIKKRLPIGRGGAILTNDEEFYKWSLRARYDGRDLTTKYDSPEHVSQAGWHLYMTPEDAARGIIIMDQLSEYSDTMSYLNYPPLNDFEFFRNNKNIWSMSNS